MSPLHSRDTDPYQGAFQNLSLISLPRLAWLLQLIGRGVVVVGSTVTWSLTSRATNQMVRLEVETFMQDQ